MGWGVEREEWVSEVEGSEVMKYTADFRKEWKVGDMFQSMNGDVWVVLATMGARADKTYGMLWRAMVERIWQYEETR